MRSIIFITIVLISGALAGLIYGTVNFVIVEPYLDEAIGLENQNLFDSGKAQDTQQFWAEYEVYRMWQKGGQVYAGVILGIAFGSLFGIVYALSRDSLPGNHNVQKTLALAGVMLVTLYLIPFLKYPANPPTVGEESTIVLRATLYLAFIAISGLGALGFYKISKKLNKKFLSIAGYGIFILIVFFVMPDNPDKVTAPMNLVNEFRLMSVLGIFSFWTSLGIILGLFWNRFEPVKRTI